MSADFPIVAEVWRWWWRAFVQLLEKMVHIIPAGAVRRKPLPVLSCCVVSEGQDKCCVCPDAADEPPSTSALPPVPTWRFSSYEDLTVGQRARCRTASQHECSSKLQCVCGVTLSCHVSSLRFTKKLHVDGTLNRYMKGLMSGSETMTAVILHYFG